MEYIIYNKSCLEGIKEVKNNSINLIITSPPYWDLKDYGHDEQLGLGMTYEYYFDSLKNILKECVRVLKNDSFCVINVADIRRNLNDSQDSRPKIISLHCDIINYFQSMGLDFFAHYIWRHKINHSSGKIYGAQKNGILYPPYVYNELSMEHILVFRKGGPQRKLPKLEDREDKFSLDEKSDWLQPIWDINSSKCALHPATFPEELVERLICLYSITGDTILDPFCGTGTTLVIADKLNRSCIGYEINLNFLQMLIDKWGMTEKDNCYLRRID